MKITLGKNLETGKKFEVDLKTLQETRLLLTANSGGGKSVLLRKILEEAHGKIQLLLLDLEGEFLTLREKFDFILVSKDGDVKIDVRAAELLAKKLLELNADAIIDLSELKKHERMDYVKKFLDSMIEAPKSLWHPVLVVIDEIHQFCPEKEQSESANSVIDLATRGRKRGFCLLGATQRLSKFNKDSAAELNNCFVGRIGLDVDQKRAGDLLGLTSKEQIRALRDLDPGCFFAYGPAISRSVVKVKIDMPKTTCPKTGSHYVVKTVPTEKIKKILEKFGDLPKEVEAELKTIEDYKKKNRDLSFQLRQLKMLKPTTNLVAISSKLVDPKELVRAEQRGFKKAEESFTKEFYKLQTELKKADSKLNQISKVMGGTQDFRSFSLKPQVKFVPSNESVKPLISRMPKISNDLQWQPSPESRPQPESQDNGELKLDRCAKAIYSLLYSNPERAFAKSLAAVLTGYSHTSGGFNNSLARLNSLGLITRSGNSFKVKEMNEELTDHQSWDIKMWVNKLEMCPRKILDFMLQDPYREFTKEELGEFTGYSASSGGFNNGIARLSSLGLIKRVNGAMKINEEIIEFLGEI